MAVRIGYLLAFLMLAMPPTAALAQAGVPESGPVADEMALRVQANDSWRRTIPDYEMRLYERVTAIKNHQIGLMRLIGVGFTVVVSLLVALIVIVVQRARGAIAPVSTVVGGYTRPEGIDGAGTKASWIDRLELATLRRAANAISHRQHRIEATFTEIQGSLAARHDDLAALIAAFRTEIEALEKAQRDFALAVRRDG